MKPVRCRRTAQKKRSAPLTQDLDGAAEIVCIAAQSRGTRSRVRSLSVAWAELVGWRSRGSIHVEK